MVFEIGDEVLVTSPHVEWVLGTIVRICRRPELYHVNIPFDGWLYYSIPVSHSCMVPAGELIELERIVYEP